MQTREPLSPKSIDLAIPDDPAGLPDWLEGSAAELVATLAGADPDAECWTWTADHHVRFWSRRMAHETAVHRWDGQGASGSPEPFDGALAVDGIDEHLENLPFILGAEQTIGAGESLHLHCTDRDGEWLLRLGADGLEVRRSTPRATSRSVVRRPTCSWSSSDGSRLPPSRSSAIRPRSSTGRPSPF